MASAVLGKEEEGKDGGHGTAPQSSGPDASGATASEVSKAFLYSLQVRRQEAEALPSNLLQLSSANQHDEHGSDQPPSNRSAESAMDTSNVRWKYPWLTCSCRCFQGHLDIGATIDANPNQESRHYPFHDAPVLPVHGRGAAG
eukprot:656818-Rhodomonas_salina.1